jgi:GT2 family glycosyltransferase
LGFGGGNNLGARHSESEYLVFLNSDTVLTENILSPLKNAFESNSDLQIVSPLLRLEDGKVQPYLAGDFATLMGLVLRKNGDASRKLGALDAKSPVLLPVDWVSGCALTIRRCQFEKLGGFSDDYFMYFEDQDLCKRSSLLGGKTALLTTASLTHLGGKSIAKTKERYRLYDTSQDIFWRKYHSSLSGLMLKILRVPYRWFSR